MTASAASEPLVLVPNRGIQQLVLAEYFPQKDHETGAARKAPLVDVFSLWAGHLLERALLVSGKACLIQPSQLRLRRMWENAIRSTDQQSLLPGDVQSLAREAMEADRLCEHWLIPSGRVPGRAWSDEGFCRWRERVHASLEAHDWLDSAGALRELAALLETDEVLPVVLPACITLRGFIEQTPLESRLMAALQSRGVQLLPDERSLPPAREVSAERMVDREAEIWAAADWARQRLAAGAERVAVAVNDFRALRPGLERAFRQTFEPVNALTLSTPESPAFHLHGGTPLAHEPMVQAAFDLLALSMSGMQRPQSFSLISRWLLSPAWLGADVESAERARLELAMRGSDRFQPTLAFTADLARKFDCPTLLELSGRIPEAACETTASRRFFAWLSHWGWPGPFAAGKKSGQLVEQFRGALEELEFSGDAADSDALHDLKQLCLERQVRGAGGILCPVQILPLENLAGGQFSELRVINVHAENWPGPVRMNRLLPFSLSRWLPRSDMQRQFKHFEVLQQEILCRAPRAIFTRADQAEGVKTSLSPLVEALGVQEKQGVACGTPLSLSVWPGAGDEVAVTGRDDLIEVARETGPDLGAMSELRSVVSILNLQSACPWAAFLVHRLEARFPAQPVPFADAAFTGSLVHTALERLYRPHIGSDGLPATTDVPAAVSRALESRRVRARLAPAAIEAERRRIERLLQEWLACEQTLTLGQPRLLEESREADFAGFTFQVRLDRLDRLPSGSLVLDYKTGSLPKMSWGDERPGELQLPLYAVLAQGDPEPPMGVGLLSLRGGEMKQAIWSGTPDIKGKSVKLVETARAIPFSDWQTTVASWTSSLEGLLDEYRSGVNELRVYRPEALRWTGLEIILRLDADLVPDEQGGVSNEA